jgi:hypothetical protein
MPHRLLLTLVLSPLLATACTSAAPTRLAAETPTFFRLTQQDAGLNPPSDEADATEGDSIADTAEAPMPTEPAAGDTAQDDEWTYGFTPYIWATSIKGSTTIKGVKSDVDESFGDILSKTDLGAMFFADARHGKTVLFLQNDYIAISDKDKVSGLTVDAKGSLYAGSLFAGHVLGEGNLDDPIVFVGLRYWHLYSDVKIKTGGTTLAKAKGKRDWWDPLIGLKKRWELDERWGLTASGNVGGFGLGHASSHTYGATIAAVRTSDGGDRFIAGWRHLRVYKTEGSGANRFEFRAKFTGPILGWSFRF